MLDSLCLLPRDLAFPRPPVTSDLSPWSLSLSSLHLAATSLASSLYLSPLLSLLLLSLPLLSLLPSSSLFSLRSHDQGFQVLDHTGLQIQVSSATQHATARFNLNHNYLLPGKEKGL